VLEAEPPWVGAVLAVAEAGPPELAGAGGVRAGAGAYAFSMQRSVVDDA